MSGLLRSVLVLLVGPGHRGCQLPQRRRGHWQLHPALHQGSGRRTRHQDQPGGTTSPLGIGRVAGGRGGSRGIVQASDRPGSAWVRGKALCSRAFSYRWCGTGPVAECSKNISRKAAFGALANRPPAQTPSECSKGTNLGRAFGAFGPVPLEEQPGASSPRGVPNSGGNSTSPVPATLRAS